MKIPTTKHGLKVNPVGFQVTMPWKGRTLLGDVRGARYDETRCGIVLTVAYFNGESWPIEPMVSAVDVMERR